MQAKAGLGSELRHMHPFLLPVPLLATFSQGGSLAPKPVAFSQTPQLTGLAGRHLREERETH